MKNRYFLFAFFLCYIILSPICALAEDESAKLLYESAFKSILAGDYEEAYNRFNEIIRSYPDTEYARFAEDRRLRLERMNLPGIRQKKIDQSGRIGSVIFGTLYSTWLGIGTVILTKADSDKAIAAGMMIGAPVGLFTSLALTRNSRISEGQAALISYSGYWGTWQGLGWAIVLDQYDDDKTLVGGAMAGGLSGILVTSLLTRKIDPSLGDAGIIIYGATWGTWLSLCSGIIADTRDGNNLMKLMLIGGDLGAALMMVAAAKTEIGLASSSMVNLSGIVGTIIALGALLITQPDSEETAFIVLMSGGILGLVGGSMEYASKPVSQISTLNRTANSQYYKTNAREMKVNIFSAQF